MEKVHEKKEADDLLSSGWSQPEQMDPEEIYRRQSAAATERSNMNVAKRVFDIV